jgi:hypothetical protein
MDKYQKYRSTEKGKITNRKASAKYDNTEQGRTSKKLRNQRYFATERGKAVNRAKVAKYKAAKLQRIPVWMTKDELKMMRFFYINCPEGCDVDHIVPLQGENVSGLHILSNLQYLTKEENGRKGNKFS